MKQCSDNFVAVTMLLRAWSDRLSSNVHIWPFVFLFDGTKYPRWVHQSPNILCHVYIAAHVR